MCHSRADEYEDLTEDVYYQVQSATRIQIVEGSVFPQCVAGSEQHCTERVQPDQFKGLVTTNLKS